MRAHAFVLLLLVAGAAHASFRDSAPARLRLLSSAEAPGSAGTPLAVDAASGPYAREILAGMVGAMLCHVLTISAAYSSIPHDRPTQLIDVLVPFAIELLAVPLAVALGVGSVAAPTAEGGGLRALLAAGVVQLVSTVLIVGLAFTGQFLPAALLVLADLVAVPAIASWAYHLGGSTPASAPDSAQPPRPQQPGPSSARIVESPSEQALATFRIVPAAPIVAFRF